MAPAREIASSPAAPAAPIAASPQSKPAAGLTWMTGEATSSAARPADASRASGELRFCAVGAGVLRHGELLQFRLGYERPVAGLGWRRPRAGPTALAAGAGAVWVADGSRRLWRIDARTHDTMAVDAGVPLAGVTVGAGAVWAFCSRPATVVRIDPGSGATTRIPIATRGGSAAPSPIGIAATSRAVWALNANTATVTRIDAEQGGVTTTIDIGVDRAPRGIATAGETVWVANSDGTLSRIAAAGGEPATVWVGESLDGVAATRGRVWVTTRALDRQISGGPS
jgi:hypothetical protein